MNRQQKKHFVQCRNLERNRRIQFNMSIGQSAGPTNGEGGQVQQSLPFTQTEIEFYTDREEIIIS
jgi:hypothetical protein